MKLTFHGMFRVSIYSFLLAIGSVTAIAQQKPCATASKFGPDDQIGNVNYITPEKTLSATKLVTKGKAYRLGIETEKKPPAYGTPTFPINPLPPGQTSGGTPRAPPNTPSRLPPRKSRRKPGALGARSAWSPLGLVWSFAAAGARGAKGSLGMAGPGVPVPLVFTFPGVGVER